MEDKGSSNVMHLVGQFLTTYQHDIQGIFIFFGVYCCDRFEIKIGSHTQRTEATTNCLDFGEATYYQGKYHVWKKNI